MQRNLRTLDQVGDINTLLQSVEARQTEMEQVKRESAQMIMDINQKKDQWRTTTTLGPQVKDAHVKLKAIQKQTTKLKHDLVQAHTYWKRQWTQLDERVTASTRVMEDEARMRQIAEQIYSATRVEWDAQLDTRIDSTVKQKVDKALESKTAEVSEQFRSTGEQYTAEIKEFIEAAAKIQHDMLITCGA